MNKIRAACLMVTVAVMAMNPRLVRAEPDTCCNNFVIFCDGFCYEHGGTLMTDCHVGMGCLEVCFCVDDREYAEGPHYCAPCS